MFSCISAVHVLLVSYCFVISFSNYVYGYYLEFKIRSYKRVKSRLNYTNNLKLLKRDPFPAISSSFPSRTYFTKNTSSSTITDQALGITEAKYNPSEFFAGQVDETRVFVLLPARNEAKNIVQCLESLVKQRPSINGSKFSLKILVMDDDSSDGTFELASSVASSHPNQVHIFRSGNLIPDDWYGKSYTLHRLYQIAVTCFLTPPVSSYSPSPSKRNEPTLDFNIHHPTFNKDDSIRHPTQLTYPFLPFGVNTSLTSKIEEAQGQQNVTRSNTQPNYRSNGNEDESEGTYFLLTDADTIHEPDSISRSLDYIRYFNVHFISGFPRQVLGTLGEVITVPIMFVVRMFIPFILLNQMPYSWSTFAIGQYMMISKRAFATVNGMEGVKKEVCEDLALAQLTRSKGFGTKFIPIRSHVTCRMYRSYGEGFYGISKTIYPALRSNILMTLISMMFFVLSSLTLLPLISLVIESFWIGESNIKLYCNLIPNFVILLSWCLVLCSEGLPFYFAIFWPISCLNSMLMALYSFCAITCFDGILWKERRVK